MFKILVWIFLCGYCSIALSQDSLLYDTSQTVLIEASRIDLLGKQIEIDQQDLVKALDRSSSIHLQSNGPGLLSTGLIHGFGARHTAILWEGFNIQSPINGTYDLGLLTGFDKVSYTDRSLSTYLGTASLGGAILLDNSNQPQTTVAKLSLNSTQNLRTSLSHSVKYSKLQTQISLGYIDNKNAFNYKWSGEVNEWLTKVKGVDVKWNNAYQINEQLTLNGDLWISKFDRVLPSSLASTATTADQEDDNYRYRSSITYRSDSYAFKLNYAHFNEQLNYLTSSVDSRAKNKVNAVNFSFAKAGHKLNLSHRTDKADANFFTQEHTRKLSTISYKYDKQWQSGIYGSVIISEQLYDSNWSPVIFDLTSGYSSKEVKASISINSAYNIPTLNDLYWPQGGNPALLPERAYGVDLDIKYFIKEKTSIALEPYYKHVSNWILWTPGDQFWSPKNQRSVVSKGFDIGLKSDLNESLSGGIDLTYTNASIAKEANFKELEGKQLLYIPKVKSHAWIQYSFGGYQLRPQVLYVSQRYTSTDNQNSIPGYGLLDIQIAKQIELKENNIVDIGCTVYNLLNKDYQQVEFYPMPLRYVELNLKYKIKRK